MVLSGDSGPEPRWVVARSRGLGQCWEAPLPTSGLGEDCSHVSGSSGVPGPPKPPQTGPVQQSRTDGGPGARGAGGPGAQAAADTLGGACAGGFEGCPLGTAPEEPGCCPLHLSASQMGPGSREQTPLGGSAAGFQHVSGQRDTRTPSWALFLAALA